MFTPTSAPPTSAEARVHVDVVFDDIVVIELEGEFDMDNVALIAQETELALDQRKHLIFDLSAATFIDCTVINLLYRTHSAAVRRGQVTAMQLPITAVIDRVLQFSGIEKAMPRSADRNMAIKRIRQLERGGQNGWPPKKGLFLHPNPEPRESNRGDRGVA